MLLRWAVNFQKRYLPTCPTITQNIMIFHVCFYADCSIGWHTLFLYYSPYILFNVWEMANYFSDQDHVATYFYFSRWQSSLVYCLHWTQYSIPFFSTCHNCSLKCNPSCHEFNHVVWSTTLVSLTEPSYTCIAGGHFYSPKDYAWRHRACVRMRFFWTFLRCCQCASSDGRSTCWTAFPEDA